MRNKITLIILRNTASKVNQITFSRSFMIAACLFMTIFLIGSVVMVSSYFNLRQVLSDNEILHLSNDTQRGEIETKRQQIKIFAEEINNLKSKLLELNQFEKKIRIIANIEKTGDSESLFGVGGSAPEDLDIEVSLEKKHDGLIREMHEQVESLDYASNKQQKGLEVILEKLEEKRNILASTPSILPVAGWISSRFGYRASPFTGKREMHKGFDIATSKNSPIIATADGIITFARTKGLLGKTVVIDHGHGISTRYAHCNKILKKSGDIVKRGDIIARVGSTGRSTGPHLHYEVRVNNVQVNPAKYILDANTGSNSVVKGS